MVPPLPARVIRLRPSILDGHAAPNPPLNHRTPVQPTNITAPDTQPPGIRALATRLLFADLVAIRVHQAQVLARRAHRHVLALQLALLGPAALAQEQHPRAVDRPVAEVAVTREVERARGERVREVVADVCWRTARLVVGLALYLAQNRMAIGIHASDAGCLVECDVLIRGSFMTFLDRFSRRAVDEKLDVEAGVLVAAHCVAGVRKRDATAPNGRKTGRRDDRCMLCVCMTAAGLLVVMARGLRRCSRNVSMSWRARRSGCGGALRACTATLLHSTASCHLRPDFLHFEGFNQEEVKTKSVQ
jgi:hypothetical protein